MAYAAPKQLRMVLAATLTVSLLLAACGQATYQAKFVRYDTARDGTRIAIVRPVVKGKSADELPALVSIENLKAGDRVQVEDVGRGWDQPQWKPTASIVGRSPAAE
jgi:hypothetical protein